MAAAAVVAAVPAVVLLAAMSAATRSASVGNGDLARQSGPRSNDERFEVESLFPTVTAQ